MNLHFARLAKLAIAFGLVAGAPLAFAHGQVNWSIGVGTAFPAPRPAYIPPPQVYVQPQPSVTYIDPRQPVYVGPTYQQPAYVSPPVVVVPPGTVIQYGPPPHRHHHHYRPQPYYRYGY